MLIGLSLLQKAVAIAVAVGLVVVYGSAAIVVVRRFARRMGGRSGRRRPRWRIAAGWAAVALAVLGLACAAYGHFVESRWIEVTHLRVPTAKLPAGRSIRIIQISDLHCERTFPPEDDLVSVVSAQHPDLIVFTGDAACYTDGLETFRRCARRLAEVAPVYGVRGNWDNGWADSPFVRTPLRELDGEAVTVSVRGAQITLVGFGAPRAPLLADVRGPIDRARPLVLLCHFPDELPLAAEQGVDLYLAGHTHGGQVRIPWYGAVITLTRSGKRFESGLYAQGGTRLYVNRGIGMEGGRAPRVRFLARPEVTVIDLVSSASPGAGGGDGRRDSSGA